MDLLIRDRTTDDVQALVNLLQIPPDEWTEETLERFKQAQHKGAYNYTDWNRVNRTISDLIQLFADAGYILICYPEASDRDHTNTPTLEESQLFIRNVVAVHEVLGLSHDPQLPNTLEHMTYATANNIEQILWNAFDALNRIERAHWYSNELYAGEV